MSLQGHKKRILVAAVALPLLLLYIIKLPAYLFVVLLVVVNAVGMWEFLKMYKTPKIWSIIGILFSVGLFLGNCFYLKHSLYFYALSFILISLARLFLKKQPQFALNDIAPLLIGLLYIPTLLSFQWFLRVESWQLIIYLYGSVWISDSFAYYIGKGFGRRKLYPEMSPKKTWEGAYGSVAGGVLGSLVIGSLLLSKPLSSLLIIGALIGIVSIFGDLVESMFKRDAGVKDSGFLFPEHGGILDKIDSMLFAGVLLYFAMKVL